MTRLNLARAISPVPDPLVGAIEMVIAGARLTLIYEGALWWATERTLVVSDLHLEKGSRMAARGQLVPPYDTELTLRRVDALVAALMPDRIISLGDAFDDVAGATRLSELALGRIRTIQAQADWIWVAGNHDPNLPEGLGGRQTVEFALGNLLFRHEPTRGAPEGEIAGHLHPAARVALSGKSVRRRCFAGDGRRLILPAMGTYTGGLSIASRAFDGLFDRAALNVGLLGEGRVYAFPGRMVLG
jgi:DNA ligase-associated metallophosphoesterase